MGVTLSPLQLRESPKNVRMEFGSEGVESEEVSRFPLEEAEVSEQPLERMSGKGSEWKERVVALGTAGRAQNRKYSELSPELRGSQSPKNAEGI